MGMDFKSQHSSIATLRISELQKIVRSHFWPIIDAQSSKWMVHVKLSSSGDCVLINLLIRQRISPLIYHFLQRSKVRLVVIVHLVLPEKLRRSCDVEVWIDASDSPVDDVGDDEGAEDGKPELVVTNNPLELKVGLKKNLANNLTEIQTICSGLCFSTARA